MAKIFKPVRIFPELYNIEDFLDQTHPVIPPDMPRYEAYWSDQARKCIEGKWGNDSEGDKGGMRWMPGGLYFHTNLCTILLEQETGEEETAPPLLRDCDWVMGYDITIGEGFSGFEDDPYRTSYRPVEKIHKGLELTPKEEHYVKIYEENLKTPEGEYKKYVSARDLLYATHDKDYGRALFNNECLNYILLGSRGFGKSWLFANAYILHTFVFDGAKTFEQFASGGLSASCFVGAPSDAYLEETLSKVRHNWNHLYNNVGSYQFKKAKLPGYFYHPTSGTLKAGSKIQYTKEFKDESGQGTHGTGTKIVNNALSTATALAAVSYRVKKMLVDEAGLLGDVFDKVHGSSEATKERETKTGMTAYIGTGGSMKRIKGIKSAYLKPSEYKSIGIPDFFSGTNNEVGQFMPAYYRRSMFKDKNGNTDLEKAFKQELLDRGELSGTKLHEYILSYPLIPEEMFLEQGDNKFPVEKAGVRKLQLEEGAWDEITSVGKLVYVDREKGQVKFVPDLEGTMKPILQYGDEDRLEDDEKEGAILIYESPSFPLPEPTFKNPRYIVLYDPVREDEGSSLCSVLCFKLFEPEDDGKIQFNLVAEWIGRKKDLEDNHEVAFKMAGYYNAKILYEDNIRDFRRYAKQTQRNSMLQPRPSLALDGFITQKRQYETGIRVSPGMKPTMEDYVKEVMLYVVDRKEEIVEDEHIIEEITMIDQCPSLRFLSETIAYRRGGNYDAMSAMMLFGIWIRQDRMDVNPEEGENELKSGEELKKLIDGQRQQLYESFKQTSAFNY